MRSFEKKLHIRGVVLLHDSLRLALTDIYGSGRSYVHQVRLLVEDLRRQTDLQVLNLPFGDGVALVTRCTRPMLTRENNEVPILQLTSGQESARTGKALWTLGPTFRSSVLRTMLQKSGAVRSSATQTRLVSSRTSRARQGMSPSEYRLTPLLSLIRDRSRSARRETSRLSLRRTICSQ